MVEASRLSRKGLSQKNFGGTVSLPSDLRDAVLVDYNGQSDELVLGGSVTAAEALKLFQAHPFPNGVSVEEVSAAEIYGRAGKKAVWLPVEKSWGQQISYFKGVDAKQVREITKLKADVSELEHLIVLQKNISRELERGLREAEDIIDIGSANNVDQQKQIKELEERLASSITPPPWWQFWK